MRANSSTIWVLILITTLSIGSAFAQTPTAANIAGDWKGSLDTPAGSLPLVLHLTAVDNKLTATLDSPAQGAYGLPGSNAQLRGSNFSFEVPSVHGNYSGTVSADGKTISGTWTQGQSIKLVLKQIQTASETAKVKPSPIDGDWSGTLQAGDMSLRVVFHFQAAPDGKISCSLDSLDQGAMGIACGNVKLTAQKLTLDAPPVHGTYSGTLSADGNKLSGTWTQNVPLPLELTRLPKAPGASVAPPAPTPAGPPIALANLKSAVDKELAPVIAAWPQAGLVIGVSVGGERKTFAYGTAKTDSIFEIGSVTKTFTALALAQMVEQDKVSLHEPLRDLLPPGTVTKPASGEEITLLDLATQHSGLPRLPDNFAEHATPADPYANYTAQDAYHFLAQHGVARPEKTEFLYSNYGFGLLGQALADKAGESYAALIQQQITGPLALKDTTVELSAAQQPRLIQGYNGAHEKAHQWTFQSMAGAGALHSTVDDLLTYAEAYLHPDRISAAGSGAASTLPAALQLAQQPQADGLPGTRIALAWLIRAESNVYWHDGGTAGYASFVSFEPKRDRAIVVLYNCLDMNPSKPQLSDLVAANIRALMDGKPTLPIGK